MITEFTCGIHHAQLAITTWSLMVNNALIGVIEKDGQILKLSTIILFSPDDLIEIAVLMNNIKRQYKQLQTT